MYPTKNDLSKSIRTKAIELLNNRLADCIDLQTQCKQAHWNVEDELHRAARAVRQGQRGRRGVRRRDRRAGRAARWHHGRNGPPRRQGVAPGRVSRGPRRRQGSTSRPCRPLWPRSARRPASRSTRPTSWATQTPPTFSPRFRAASTSGSGSSKPTNNPTSNRSTPAQPGDEVRRIARGPRQIRTHIERPRSPRRHDEGVSQCPRSRPKTAPRSTSRTGAPANRSSSATAGPSAPTPGRTRCSSSPSAATDASLTIAAAMATRASRGSATTCTRTPTTWRN